MPADTTSVVHEFRRPRRRAFRVSLTHDELDRTGKSAARTDRYHGRFAQLVPNERVVEVLEFETADPARQGEMTITTTVTDADDGTDVAIEYEGLPPRLGGG